MKRLAAALVLAAVAVAMVSGQSTCVSGRVSLSSLPTTTYVLGSNAYTVSFCSPGSPTTTALASCGATGYVQDHFTSNGTCRSNYNTVATALTQYTDGAETGVFFIASADGAAATIVANVTVVCDMSGTAGTVSLAGVTDTWDGTTRKLHLRLRSYNGCQVSNLFCSDSITCADSARTCVNGVCFNTACATISTISSSSAASSAFSGQYSVADCHGTPLAGLDRGDFTVALNGVDTDGTVYRNEVPIAIGTAPQATPAITTLLLDQSSSVTDTAQATLQAAARTYVETVAQSNANHYVAVIAFDGAAEPVVVLQHTNDHAAIINAINNSLPPSGRSDPQSTNLYGAVISGVRTANAMRFSFGPANATVVSSMIVFTDGYDTAGRSTRAAAVTEVNKFAASVNVISIGVAATSDTQFLTDIATSGIYSFPTTTELVSSFSDVAAQVAATANSVYSAALCIPIRSSQVTVSIRMNSTEGYTTSRVGEFVVNASGFTGGCTQSTVDGLAASGGSANTTTTGQSTEPVTLDYGSTLSKTLGPAEAVFVTFTVTNTDSVVVVTPSTLTVRYLTSNRCILSPYCYDGIFNGTFVPSNGVTYRAAVENSADATNAVTVYFGSGVVTTTTQAPVATITSAPLATISSGGASPMTLTYNISEVREGDVDEEATWVFLGFGIATIVVIVGLIIASAVMNAGSSPRQADKSRFSPSRAPAFTVPARYSGGDSMAYLATPSTAHAMSPRGFGTSVLHHSTGSSVPPPVPLMSGVSPYRGTPYRMTNNTYGRAFVASPSRNLDEL